MQTCMPKRLRVGFSSTVSNDDILCLVASNLPGCFFSTIIVVKLAIIAVNRLTGLDRLVTHAKEAKSKVPDWGKKSTLV
jgi:hypothetical protein